jgi:hypothetical protein
MRGILQAVLVLCAGYVGLAGQAGNEISATFVPDEVKPGDIFELRVEMDRAGYARFSLEIPVQPHLHRIAVEAVPVSFSEGRYRQAEKWLLQADSSGEYIIKDAQVVLDSKGSSEVVSLPELRLTVVPYGEVDSSNEPSGFIEGESILETSRPNWLIGLVVVVIVAGSILVMQNQKKRRASEAEEASNLLSLAAVELEERNLGSPVLEKLIHEPDCPLPEALREQLVRAVYSGNGDFSQLAADLRKEAAR